MPVRIQARIQDDGADTQLARLATRLIDRQPAMDEIGGELQASTFQRFRDQRGPDGQAWEPLSFATWLGRAGRKAKKKDGTFRKAAVRRLNGAKILRDTGELFNSINFEATPSRISVGTNKKYARIQQLGGEAGRRDSRVTIPARPFLGISEDDQRTVAEILSAHLGGR